nr:MAG TPA: hypothetical protein [Caudoviricetes sp.]
MADFVRTEMHRRPAKNGGTEDFHKCEMWKQHG